MWFNKVKNDLSQIPDMVDYYNREIDAAQSECKISGSLERNSQDLPGQVSWRFSQLQELEAVLKHLNNQVDKLRSDLYRRYLERYNRELTDRAIEKYIDGETDVQTMMCLVNEVALLRNKYLGVIKALEIKGFQLNNIIRLRVVGMNDADL
jgi:hypothetical protein